MVEVKLASVRRYHFRNKLYRSNKVYRCSEEVAKTLLSLRDPQRGYPIFMVHQPPPPKPSDTDVEAFDDESLADVEVLESAPRRGKPIDPELLTDQEDDEEVAEV